MNTNRTLKTIGTFILLLALVAAGYWFFFLRPAVSAAGALTASGTVETTEISIAPELSGKITEINVQEGDVVKSGDLLFRLDDSLLQAQRKVVAAGLETAKTVAASGNAAVASAQAQYDMAFNAAMLQNKPGRTVNWVKSSPDTFTLPLWYYNQAEQISAAQAEADAALVALTRTQDKLASVQASAASADFVKAENDLAAAQASYQVANDLHNRVDNSKNIDNATRRQLFLLYRDKQLQNKGLDPKWVDLSNINADLVSASKKIFDDAKSNLKDAQSAYLDAITSIGAQDVLKARADVSMAQERYYTALDYVRILQTGAESPAVTAAQKLLDQAKSGAAQAQAAVNQAQASLEQIDVQIMKTSINAPVDGVVLTRVAQPGSVVNAGGVMLTIGRLDELTITVYVPEDRVGEVMLGQMTSVTVDSFAGETFKASVSYISSQAEFTPRNVQTVDGRKNTVFAVKLKLEDTSGRLKPGMPADVSFAKK